MPNLGDIDRQTLAGAISTGTHGTGAGFQGMAAQVERLALITPAGDEVRCSRSENPDLFHAACVGLGAFGVVTELTLRTVPAFGLDVTVRSADRRSIVSALDEHVRADHFEFFWFALDETAQLKTARRMAPGRADHAAAPGPDLARARADRERSGGGNV